VVKDDPGCSKSAVIKGLSRHYSPSTIDRRIGSLLDDRVLVNRAPSPNYALHVRGDAKAASE